MLALMRYKKSKRIHNELEILIVCKKLETTFLYADSRGTNDLQHLSYYCPLTNQNAGGRHSITVSFLQLGVGMFSLFNAVGGR